MDRASESQSRGQSFMSDYEPDIAAGLYQRGMDAHG